MSRTFRRKDIEYIVQGSTYQRSKIAGCYTEGDWDKNARIFVERLPTKEEAFRTFRNLHCDGRRHYRFIGMPKWGRRLEMKTDRAKHRNKINRFLKGVDDDVVVEVYPKFPSRYW